jgi:hypothetical protein
VTQVDQDPESGFITALTTHRDEVIEGDLLRRLLRSARAAHRGHAQNGLRRLVSLVPLRPRPGHTDRARAGPDSLHPLHGARRRLAMAHSPATPYGERDRLQQQVLQLTRQAAETLQAHLDSKPLADPRLIRFLTGRRKKAWNKNVVAIGLSSGFLEPLESTSIHLIQSGIAKLLSLFPTRDCHPEPSEQFNRVFRRRRRVGPRLPDPALSPLGRKAEPMWQYCQHMPLPDGVAYKMAHFTRTGRIVLTTDELFKEASWFAIMMGQGLQPITIPSSTTTLSWTVFPPGKPGAPAARETTDRTGRPAPRGDAALETPRLFTSEDSLGGYPAVCHAFGRHLLRPAQQLQAARNRPTQRAAGAVPQTEVQSQLEEGERPHPAIHARIGNARRDYLHKTSTAISQNHAMVCIEDLQVRNMSKSAAGSTEAPGKHVRAKAGLNKSILDQGWFEFRRQFKYKLSWNGGELISCRRRTRAGDVRNAIMSRHRTARHKNGSPAWNAVSRTTPIGSARSTFSGRDTPVGNPAKRLRSVAPVK